MKKKADITIILDRSGSMESIKKATIKGFNEYLAGQKKFTDSRLTLVQFDHEYKLLFEAEKIKYVRPLCTETYVPRGTTALLDAIGRTIATTRLRLKTGLNGTDAAKTVIVIITDGLENSSREYSRDRVFNLILKMEKKHGWEFVFLGANQDAILEAGFIGIDARRALTFSTDEDGMLDAFSALSCNMACYLNDGEEFEFKREQREQQRR